MSFVIVWTARERATTDFVEGSASSAVNLIELDRENVRNMKKRRRRNYCWLSFPLPLKLLDTLSFLLAKADMERLRHKKQTTSPTH